MEFLIGIAIISLLISYLVAEEFDKITVIKGYPPKKYFWWCFLLGIIGWFMVIALPDRVSEKQKQADEERAIAERLAAEKAEQERIEEKKQAEQEREAAEREKEDRITAYWEKHPEKFEALVEKRTEAKEKLSIGKLAVEQKKALQDIISAIDDELSKDREE